MQSLLFKFLTLMGDGYIDPHTGLPQASSQDKESFIETLQTALNDVYSYIQGFYWITLGIVIFGFVFAICKYGMSSINNSPRLRDEAKTDLLVSLVLVALCGAMPLIFGLIIALLRFFQT